MCENVKTITIGKGVTAIASLAFNGCGSNPTVYCLPSTPPTCEKTSFKAPLTIYVPIGSEDVYKEQWDTFADYISEYIY